MEMRHGPDSGERLRPVMFAGTGSDVGKSVIAAAFCRILRQDGWHPAPFKAQNMALNSFVTPDGLEIGRAQAAQAEAAGIECHTDMNPVLLKPSSDHTSQVVLNGRPAGNRSAREYFRQEGRGDLWKAVCSAYDRLSARYNPIVMEGAGSVSEINLRDRDIVNMPMAEYAGAAVILVADIDRGGVFASVYGSVMLQEEKFRKLIKGVIINKFRGDISLFDDGRRILEELCGVPVLGVVPYLRDVHIEDEDSVSLEGRRRSTEAGKVNVAVVLLRRMSNFTDFDALEHDPRVNLFYTDNPAQLRMADIIILPGTKSTIADLDGIRRNGTAAAVQEAARKGTVVLGICGGYQMLGEEVCDPDHVEGPQERMPGLGLLPVRTTMSGEKVTRRRKFTLCEDGSDCNGYEIHMGQTVRTSDEGCGYMAVMEDGTPEGCRKGQVMGTYLHGILDNRAFADLLIRRFSTAVNAEGMDYQTFKQQQYDLLAEHIRNSIDMDRFYRILRSHD